MSLKDIQLNFDVGFVDMVFPSRSSNTKCWWSACLGWQVRRSCGNPLPAAGEAHALLEGLRMARGYGL